VSREVNNNCYILLDGHAYSNCMHLNISVEHTYILFIVFNFMAYYRMELLHIICACCLWLLK